jgi:HD-GYP domain-containing protein (c-di-GMP phosphodiesterase class II)
MLKRINVSDVELGMFVHKLEGSWFKHPFWRSRFLLQDSDLLDDLHASDVEAVVIDISKGYDVRPMPKPPEPGPGLRLAKPQLRPRMQTRMQTASVSASQTPDFRSTAPNSMGREFGMAKQVAGKSRKVISRVFLESRLGKSIKASYVEPVIEDIFASVQRNPHAFNGLMRCKRDNEYIYRHALAVSALMISLGRQMKLAPDTIRQAGMAGLLMDVGIGMLPVDLSQYGGDYRNLDASVLNQHILLGYDFLDAGGGMSAAVLDVVLNHHELMDGTGYPNRLSGERIDLLSRMASICDGYDSMVSDTADGSGMDPASSLQQMTMMKGWYDPEILARFVETLGVYPIGSVVMLRSDRLAMVVAQDPSDYTRPRVKPFFTNLTGKFIRADEIALASCYGHDEIVETVEPSDFGIEDFPRIRERLFENAHKGGA